MKNREMRVNASVPEKEILDAFKMGRLYNQVFDIKVEGIEEPIKAIVSHYYREYVKFKPLSVNFVTYRPGKRYKVKIPAFVDNLEDSASLRKGAILQKVEDYIPCYWKGGTDIPEMIVVDMLQAKPPTTFHLDPATLPENLTLRYPKHNYVLCTLKGSRRYYNEAPEEDEEAA